MQFGIYDGLKGSGSAWLGDIPKHWGVKKLKFLATVQPSNVDKKTVEGEEPVILCNYTDVYKNDYIDSRLDFMQASATAEEIRKFSVDVGDVIVTKDSETPNDIAVPACIAEEVEGLVCGYHLTQIKPIDLYGRYLFRLFQAKGFNAQFTVAANGVTRFGLPQHAIANAFTPIPPIDEQHTIARFLDYKTAQIDALIAKKQALLDRLAEKRSALISNAVTKGLDHSVPMKDSGVPWLGMIPEHWGVIALRYACEFLNRRRIPLSAEERGAMPERIFPYYGASGIIDYVENYIFDEKTILIAEDGANLLSRSSPLAFIADGKYWVNNHAHILSPKQGPFEYWANLLGVIQYDPWITGSAQPKLSKENLGGIKLPLPPKHEQAAIVKYIVENSGDIDPMAKKIREAIDRLVEYRSALITSAVTGKIDVRSFQVSQPSEDLALA